MDRTRLYSSLPDGSRILEVAESDLPCVLDVLERAFPDVSRTFFHSIVTKDPWRTTGRVYAVERDKRLVSTIQVFDRTMMLQGERVRFGGIGGVGTDPKYQGCGYASALLRHAIEDMRQAGYDGTMLFTKIHPYYERLGWRTLEQSEIELDCKSLPQTMPPSVSYRPIAESDFDRLHAWYEHQLSDNDGRIVRTPDYWQARSAWMNHSGIAVRIHDQPVAFFYAAKYRDEEPVMTLTEFGILEPDEESRSAFWQAAVRVAMEKRCSAVCGPFLQNTNTKLFLTQHEFVHRKKPYDYIMWQDLTEYRWLDAIRESIERNCFVYWQTDAF